MKIIHHRFVDDLQGTPHCFGERYAKTSEDCQACQAPVLIEAELFLLREVCMARTRGAKNPHQLKVLTSRDVLSRLDEGQTASQIFREVLAENDPEVAGEAVRDLLVNRWKYLRYDLKQDIPDLPPIQELVNDQDPEAH